MSLPRRGWVYFAILESRPNQVKIGFSANPNQRMMKLGKAKIIAAVCGNHARERALHRRFASLRIESEWFKDEGPLRDYLAKLPVRKKKFPNRKITISLFLEENLAQTIAAEALTDRRTMSKYISIILEKHFENADATRS